VIAVTGKLRPEKLQSALDAVHRAGIPGVFAEVRDGDEVWRGAAGVADLETGRPVTPGMRQRVGSITKTFTAAAVLRQVEQGTTALDAPIGSYLPHLVPGARGETVTVRMLLNHTSGFAEYLPRAFPSFRGFPFLRDISPDSIDDHRFRRFDPVELIELGLAAPAAHDPGATPGVYSNTNYLLLGQLLAQVTGMSAEKCITGDVIERAGLRHTGFPDGPRVDGPHPRMYEALFGLIDPPRDYSVYDMSWVGPSASLVSTAGDLNRFFGALFDGEIVSRASLAQMQHTVPVIAQNGQQIDYGLGLHEFHLPGLGVLWGNDGTVWGAGTTSMTRGTRRMTVALNLIRWARPSPIDDALTALSVQAMSGDD
jgi:D-alanyl-D-alanine carboxypeptidase